MRQLIYTSVSRVGTNQAALDRLLLEARSCNGLVGVTGLLWTDGLSFAQVLEGHSEVVEETMDRIRADMRHSAIKIAADVEVAAREFGHWSMLRPLSNQVGAKLDGFAIGTLRQRGSDLVDAFANIVCNAIPGYGAESPT